jgi:hypothetical protein
MPPHLLFIGLALLSALSFGGVSASCSFDQNFVPVHAVRGRYQNAMPWNQDVANQLLAALQRVSSFYVFRDSAIYPPPSPLGTRGKIKFEYDNLFSKHFGPFGADIFFL